MRLVLIVIGVLVVLWLGFLTVDRNNVHDGLKQNEQQHEEINGQFNQLDDKYEQRQDVDKNEDNPLDKAEDEFDMKEDEIDRQIPMPYEQDETNQNTDLKKTDDNNANEPVKDEPKSKPTAGESIVAFSFGLENIYEKPSTEAFQLDIFEDNNSDSVIAFKVR